MWTVHEHSWTFHNHFMNFSRIKTSLNQRLFMNLSSWTWVHELFTNSSLWSANETLNFCLKLFMNCSWTFMHLSEPFHELFKKLKIKFCQHYSWTVHELLMDKSKRIIHSQFMNCCFKNISGIVSFALQVLVKNFSRTNEMNYSRIIHE